MSIVFFEAFVKKQKNGEALQPLHFHSGISAYFVDTFLSIRISTLIETTYCSIYLIKIFNPRAYRRDNLYVYNNPIFAVCQSTRVKNKPRSRSPGVAPTLSSYACSVGASVLVSTILTNHTAPCMTVGSTMASRQ